MCLPVDNPPSTDRGHPPYTLLPGAFISASWTPNMPLSLGLSVRLSICPFVRLSVCPSVALDRLTRTSLVGCPCQCPAQFSFFFFLFGLTPFRPIPKHCAVAAPRRLLCVRNFDINSLGQFYKRLSGLTCSSGIHIFH